MRALWIISSALVLAGAAADPRDRGPDTLDVSSYPPRYQELYKVFEVRCSKCHSLARPLNARLRADEWRLYVKKMSRRPGSGISEATAEKLTEFLTYYSKLREDADAGTPPSEQ
jgi:hypothetical protein